MIIGYARVSTEDQHLDAQTAALEAIGAERIFAEKISGTKKSRPELDRMIEQLRDGDVVIVTKYDRLSRSLQDLLSIVEAVRAKGAGFRSLAEDIDTTTPAGRYRPAGVVVSMSSARERNPAPLARTASTMLKRSCSDRLRRSYLVTITTSPSRNCSIIRSSSGRDFFVPEIFSAKMRSAPIASRAAVWASRC